MKEDILSFEPAASYENALEQAARAWGIELEYWDIFGRLRQATVETLRGILTALGVDVSSRDALDAAREQRLWREWTDRLPPVLVTVQPIPVSPAGPPDADPADPLRVRLPEAEPPEICLRFRLESGGSFDLRPDLRCQPPSLRAVLRGSRFLEWHIPLPAQLPLGYHDVDLLDSADRKTASMRLIVCPRRAWLPPRLATGKAAGVTVALYGVRSAHNWGCGDFTDLEALAAWAAQDLGASFIALNPLHSIHNRTPFNTSPYFPNSLLYKNPLYLNIERIPEFARCEPAQRLLATTEIQAELERLSKADYVDYETVYALKIRFLRMLFLEFLKEWRKPNGSTEGFKSWCAQEGEHLDRFALHAALEDQIRRRHQQAWGWSDWPPEYRRADSPEVREFARRHPCRILFHKYVQYQVHLQLEQARQAVERQGLEIGLYHDLALGADPGGSDVWANPQLFVRGCRIGAPPDDFSLNGQDWGFPPPNLDQHRQEAYRFFIDTLRLNSRYGGALRIDHVMRFFRLYWIPDGMDASQGTYVRSNALDWIRILALESVRGRFLVVGEDLGTVEPHVRDTLMRYGILSYRLFYFEKHSDGSFRTPQEYPREALVSTTTHDLPTLAGFWKGRDIEARKAAGVFSDEATYWQQKEAREQEKQRMLDALQSCGFLTGRWCAREIPELTGEIHNAVIGFLASTPSLLLAINQEDITKETEQQNLPGTTGVYPNWQRKMRFSVEELRRHPEARDYAAMVRNWLAGTCRSNVRPASPE